MFDTPDLVSERLRALATEHPVDEITILTMLHDSYVRRRSYALLMREFRLRAPQILPAGVD